MDGSAFREVDEEPDQSLGGGSSSAVSHEQSRVLPSAMDSFHSKAAESFQEQGLGLIGQLAAGHPSQSTEQQFPQPSVAAHFDDSNIQSFGHISHIDKSGREVVT